MHVNTLAAKDGWHWLSKGWSLFKKQPIGFLMIVLSYVLMVSIAIRFIPFHLGSAIVAVLTPGLTFGVFAACKSVDEGHKVNQALLIAGFRENQQQATVPLLKLGFIYLVCSLVIYGISFLMGMGHLSEALQAGTPPTAEDAELLLAILAVVSILYTPVMMIFWYSPMLVVWHRQPVIKSLFFSFIAVWRNRNAFMVYSLGWLLIALSISLGVVIASLLLGLSAYLGGMINMITMFIVLTFTACTLYPTYKDVMPLEASPEIPPTISPPDDQS